MASLSNSLHIFETMYAPLLQRQCVDCGWVRWPHWGQNRLLDRIVQARLLMDCWMTDWPNMRRGGVDRLGHDLLAIITLPTEPHISHIANLPIDHFWKAPADTENHRKINDLEYWNICHRWKQPFENIWPIWYQLWWASPTHKQDFQMLGVVGVTGATFPSGSVTSRMWVSPGDQSNLLFQPILWGFFCLSQFAGAGSGWVGGDHTWWFGSCENGDGSWRLLPQSSATLSV